MATKSADGARVFESTFDHSDLPVIASDIIYAGSAVGDNGSGYMRPLASGDPFRGFATAKVDNSSGSAGDKNVNVRTLGVVKLAVTGASAVTNVSAAVFATDDDTFTLTAGGTFFGRVWRGVTSTTCMVKFEILPDDHGDISTPIADPGDAGAISVATSGSVPLVTAGGETRTIADPTFAGQVLNLSLKTDGGNCVITTASPMNQTGNNTLTGADVGDHIILIGSNDGSDIEWRLLANDGWALSTA